MCNIQSKGEPFGLDGPVEGGVPSGPCFCRDYDESGDLAAKRRSGAVYRLFYQVFDIVIARNGQQAAEAHRLRYLVFCEENAGFEDPADNAGGLESDEFDRQSDQVLLVYKPANTVIGTLRVIKPEERHWQTAFPMQQLCDAACLRQRARVMDSCELSRLCISSTRRKFMKDHLNRNGNFGLDRRQVNLVTSLAPLGLIGGAFDLAVRQGLSNVLGVMRDKNIARLQQAGLVTRNLGPRVDHHGPRQPFMANIPETFANGLTHNSNAWIVASDFGRIHRAAMGRLRCQTCFSAIT